MSDVDRAIDEGRVPDGISAAFLKESRDDASIAGIIFVAGLTSIVVISRIICRAFVVRRFGLDDTLATISLLMLYGFVGICVHLIHLGSGRHFAYIKYVLPISTVLETETFDFIAHLIYSTTLVLCRLSGLAFYLRICSQHKAFRTAIWIVGIVIVLAFLPQFFLLIFHCLPVTTYWPYGWEPVANDYVCLQWGVVYVTNSVISLLCDFLLFGIPLAMLRGLQMSRKRKVQLACILLPGIAVVAISVTRLVLVIKGQWEVDMSWPYNPFLGVENGEIGATLIALSLPGAKQLCDTIFKRKDQSGNPHGHSSSAKTSRTSSTGSASSGLSDSQRLGSKSKSLPYDDPRLADFDLEASERSYGYPSRMGSVSTQMDHDHEPRGIAL